MAVVGMKQDRAAASASVIDGMLARTKDGRGFDNVSGARRDDYFEGDIWIGHYAPLIGGSAGASLSHRRLQAKPRPVMGLP